MAQGRCWLLALSLGISLYGASPIRDEALRHQILAAVFPNMEVADTGKVQPAKNDARFSPDSMAGARIYRIIGPAVGKWEECASEDVASRVKSDIRELSFVAYRWPRRPDLLAVLQYKFVGVGPAGACWSIGRLVHLVGGGKRWQISEDFDLDTQHHGGLERVELADLDGEGKDELLVESDWGGAAVGGSSLHVYSLKNGRFEQWLETTAQVQGMYGALTQVLDLGATRAKRAMSICFVRTDLAGPDFQVYRTPRVSRPCYARGTERTFGDLLRNQ